MIETGRPGGSFLLHYSGLAIPFHVQYRERKHLAITVHPEMKLEVSAPQGAALEQILAKVEKRARWIVRQWRFFEQYRPPQPGRRFVSGETHVYLGRQYRLKVQAGSPEGVKLIGRFLHVRTPDQKNGERVSFLLGIGTEPMPSEYLLIAFGDALKLSARSDCRQLRPWQSVR